MLTLWCVLCILLPTVMCTGEITEQEEEASLKICHYMGKVFHPGDRVTDDPCDRCFCTDSGILCEMMQCPPANCYDKVMKDCCYECPNGSNCLYNGELGSVLVPETGCTYSEGNVCYCFYDDKMPDMSDVYCLPELPGGSLPACNATEI